MCIVHRFAKYCCNHKRRGTFVVDCLCEPYMLFFIFVHLLVFFISFNFCPFLPFSYSFRRLLFGCCSCVRQNCTLNISFFCLFLLENVFDFKHKKKTVSALFPHKKVSCSWDGVKSRCVLFHHFSLSRPYEYNNNSKTKMLIWHFLKEKWNASFYVICGYIYLNNTYPRICYLFVLEQWTSLRLTRHPLLHYNNCYFAVTKQFRMIDKTFKLSSVYFEI